MAIRKNLVLGGSGTIGKALCNQLKINKEEVINLDLKDGYDLRIMSLDEYKDMDFVWFLAWDVGGAKYLYNNDHQIDILKNNTNICRHVFSFLEKYKIPFIFTSSQLASTDNSYGITKLLGELWTNHLNGKIVRLWNAYGWEDPGEKSHVITDIVMNGITKQKIELLTDGEEERQFIYIDDCVSNMITLRDKEKSVYHLTDGNWIKIKDIALSISELLQVPISFGKIKGYQNKIDPDPSYKDFVFNVKLSDGLEMIIKKAKEHLSLC